MENKPTYEELQAQVEELQLCLKERKAVCHQAFDANDALTAERDALAAQVEALRKALSDAVAAFRQYELSVDDYPTIKHKLFMQALNDELETTPQQHLAEIRAEAGRDGFVAGYEFCLSTLPSPYCNLIAVNYKGMAERYADKIRQEVK